jgi:hypothetical protein
MTANVTGHRFPEWSKSVDFQTSWLVLHMSRIDFHDSVDHQARKCLRKCTLLELQAISHPSLRVSHSPYVVP